MHSVCLGVVRQMVDLWVNSSHHGEEYYIGQRVKLIDECLQLISPPSEIHRSPRSLSRRCYWKASEWRAFIFYSLIVLRGILPARYLNHFFLFVYGIYVLLGNSISNESIALSEVCLAKFVIQLEQLYGISSCKFNAHCLTHLGFCFKTRLCQLLGTVLMMILLPLRDILVKLTENVRFKHKSDCSGLSPLGSETLVTLDARRVVALQGLLGIDLENRVGQLYDRFVYGHQLYSGVDYVRSKRRTNHNISFKHPLFAYGVSPIFTLPLDTV